MFLYFGECQQFWSWLTLLYSQTISTPWHSPSSYSSYHYCYLYYCYYWYATTTITTSTTLLSLALSTHLFLNFLVSHLLKSLPIVKILTETSQQRQFFCLKGNIHLDIRLPVGFRWQLGLSLEENFSFLAVEMGIALADTRMTRIWTNKSSEAKFGALVLHIFLQYFSETVSASAS